MEFLPKYIRQVVEKLQGQVVTAEEWNNLFNLLIQQGDNNTEGIVNVINNLSENYPTTQLVQELITQYIKKIGAADMSTEIYDTDKDGIVDQAATVNDGAITNEKIADGAVTEEKIQKDLIDLIKYLEQVVSILSIQNLLDVELEGSRNMYTFGWDEQAKLGYRLSPADTTNYSCFSHIGGDKKKMHITNGTTSSSTIPLITGLNLNKEYLIRDLKELANTHAIKINKHNEEIYELSGKVTRLSGTASSSNHSLNVVGHYNKRYLLQQSSTSTFYLIDVDDDLKVTELAKVSGTSSWNTTKYSLTPNTVYDYACRTFSDNNKAPGKVFIINGLIASSSSSSDIKLNYIEADLIAGTITKKTISSNWSAYVQWRHGEGCIGSDGNFYWFVCDYQYDDYDAIARIFKNDTEIYASATNTYNETFACGRFLETSPNHIVIEYGRFNDDDNEFRDGGSSFNGMRFNIYNGSIASGYPTSITSFSSAASVKYDSRAQIFYDKGTTYNDYYVCRYTGSGYSLSKQSKFVNYAEASRSTGDTVHSYPIPSAYVSSSCYRRISHLNSSSSHTYSNYYMYNLSLTQSTLATLKYIPEGSTSSTTLTFSDIFIDLNNNIALAFCYSGSSTQYMYVEANRFMPDSYEVTEELPLWFTAYGFIESRYQLDRLDPCLTINANAQQTALINLRDVDKTYTNLNLILQLDRQKISEDSFKVYYNVSKDDEQFVEIPLLEGSTSETLYYEVKFDEPKTIYSIKVVAKAGNQPLIIKKVLGGVDNEI